MVEPKKEPVIEWSAMEWNGKNEIDELHQKIKVLLVLPTLICSIM